MKDIDFKPANGYLEISVSDVCDWQCKGNKELNLDRKPYRVMAVIFGGY